MVNDDVSEDEDSEDDVEEDLVLRYWNWCIQRSDSVEFFADMNKDSRATAGRVWEWEYRETMQLESVLVARLKPHVAITFTSLSMLYI